MIFLSLKGMTAQLKNLLRRQKALQTDSVKSLKQYDQYLVTLTFTVLYQQNGRFPDLCILTAHSLPDFSVAYLHTATQLQ
jgi:hypothetical protein